MSTIFKIHCSILQPILFREDNKTKKIISNPEKRFFPSVLTNYLYIQFFFFFFFFFEKTAFSMNALLNPLWAFLKLFFIINTFVIPSKDVLYWQLYSERTVECRADGLQKIWRESFVPQSSSKWEKDFLLPGNYEARNGTILCHSHTMRWIVGVIFLVYNFKIIIAILGFNTWTSFQNCYE